MGRIPTPTPSKTPKKETLTKADYMLRRKNLTVTIDTYSKKSRLTDKEKEIYEGAISRRKALDKEWENTK